MDNLLRGIFNHFLAAFCEPLRDEGIQLSFNDGIVVKDLIVRPDAINQELEKANADMRIDWGKIGLLRICYTALPGVVTMQMNAIDFRVRPNALKTLGRVVRKAIANTFNPPDLAEEGIEVPPPPMPYDQLVAVHVPHPECPHLWPHHCEYVYPAPLPAAEYHDPGTCPHHSNVIIPGSNGSMTRHLYYCSNCAVPPAQPHSVYHVITPERCGDFRQPLPVINVQPDELVYLDSQPATTSPIARCPHGMPLPLSTDGCRGSYSDNFHHHKRGRSRVIQQPTSTSTVPHPIPLHSYRHGSNQVGSATAHGEVERRTESVVASPATPHLLAGPDCLAASDTRQLPAVVHHQLHHSAICPLSSESSASGLATGNPNFQVAASRHPQQPSDSYDHHRTSSGVAFSGSAPRPLDPARQDQTCYKEDDWTASGRANRSFRFSVSHGRARPEITGGPSVHHRSTRENEKGASRALARSSLLESGIPALKPAVPTIYSRCYESHHKATQAQAPSHENMVSVISENNRNAAAAEASQTTQPANSINSFERGGTNVVVSNACRVSPGTAQEASLSNRLPPGIAYFGAPKVTALPVSSRPTLQESYNVWSPQVTPSTGHYGANCVINTTAASAPLRGPSHSIAAALAGGEVISLNSDRFATSRNGRNSIDPLTIVITDAGLGQISTTAVPAHAETEGPRIDIEGRHLRRHHHHHRHKRHSRSHSHTGIGAHGTHCSHRNDIYGSQGCNGSSTVSDVGGSNVDGESSRFGAEGHSVTRDLTARWLPRKLDVV